MPAFPPISVVIPLFNGAKYIEAALTSVRNQTVPVAEILVIDDGSTDDGPELVRHHPAGATLVQQENRGPSAARNRGIQMAKSPFLAFIDQDDLWRSDKLTLQCAAFEADPDLVVCFGRIDYFWEDPDCAEAKAYADHARTNAVEGYVTTTMLARASVFETVGFYDESLKFGDSIEWCAKMRDMGVKSRMLDEVILDHRMHDTNLTRQRQNSSSEILGVLARRRKAAKEVSRD